MKTPLDIALEKISEGCLNPTNITQLCIMYNNLRFLRTFNIYHHDYLKLAVQSGGLAMVNHLLNQPYYNITPHIGKNIIREIEDAIMASSRYDMFTLLLNHARTYIDLQKIRLHVVRCNKPQLYNLLPRVVAMHNMGDLCKEAILYESDKIKPLLPKLTFDWFIDCLPLRPNIVEEILSARPDFTTPRRMIDVATVILRSTDADAEIEPYLDIFVKYNMLQWILYQTHISYILIWACKYHPEYMTRYHLERCLHHLSYESLRIVCNTIPVDLELLLHAANIGVNMNTLKTLISIMKGQSTQSTPVYTIYTSINPLIFYN